MFETRKEFVFAGMRAQSDKGGGRILLGDNTSGRTIMLRSGFSLLESGIHLDSCVHTKF
jgi:hypothetical protein